MAQYSINTGPLSEAGEDFLLFAAQLDRARETVDSILSQWSEGMPEIKRQLSGAKESIYEVSRKTRELSLTLSEVIDCYTEAERTAFSGHHRDSIIRINARQDVVLPKIRSTSSVMMFDRTVMPDWLRNATLEYSQAQITSE